MQARPASSPLRNVPRRFLFPTFASSFRVPASRLQFDARARRVSAKPFSPKPPANCRDLWFSDILGNVTWRIYTAKTNFKMSILHLKIAAPFLSSLRAPSVPRLVPGDSVTLGDTRNLGGGCGPPAARAACLALNERPQRLLAPSPGLSCLGPSGSAGWLLLAVITAPPAAHLL